MVNIESKKYLLVLPEFPIARKSKAHKDGFPVGLMKISTYLKRQGNEVRFVMGNNEVLDYRPEEIFVTSIFTYWASYVKGAVIFYKAQFPNAILTVGGIYATLMPDHCREFTGCDQVHIGTYEDADDETPDYDLFEKTTGVKLKANYLWTSRGCTKKCSFCGTWRLEPKRIYKKTILQEIDPDKRYLVFYDNNLLANPHIVSILEELQRLKEEKIIFRCDAQSGVDVDILVKKPSLAKKMHRAGFRDIRIAWDGPVTHYTKIKEGIMILRRAGFDPKQIWVFMLYNYELPFAEMEEKRKYCWEWQTQIADCRYRPLDQVFDNYLPYRKIQSAKDYFIHENWTDAEIRKFRRHIRMQNMAIRFSSPFYSNIIENSHYSKDVIHSLLFTARTLEKNKLITLLDELKLFYWFPEDGDDSTTREKKRKNELKQFERVTGYTALEGGRMSELFIEWRNKNQLDHVTRFMMKELAIEPYAIDDKDERQKAILQYQEERSIFREIELKSGLSARRVPTTL